MNRMKHAVMNGILAMIVLSLLCGTCGLAAAVRADAQQDQAQEQKGKQQEAAQVQPPQPMRASEKQADQIRACLKGAYRTRTEAKMIEKSARDPHFKNFIAPSVDSVRQEFQKAQGEHQKFLGNLSADHLKRLQERTGSIDEICSRADIALKKMDQEASQGNPDPNRIVPLALQIGREMEEWQRIYRSIGTDMGIRFDAGPVKME